MLAARSRPTITQVFTNPVDAELLSVATNMVPP